MSNIYIVTSGEYSDYGISTVFSSREKAQAWIDLHSDGSDYNIEEYVLDECAEHVALTRYEANIDLESGSILSTNQHPWVGPNIRTEPPEETDFRHMGRWDTVPVFGYHYAKVVSYVSAEHALKLAAEHRQAWLRKKTEPVSG